MKKMNKKGFTIVELVIVIAVIAILSAVLIPTFSGVVGEANKTAAVADAKAVYQQYVADATLKGEEAKKNVIYYVDDAKDLYVVVDNGQVGNAYTADELEEAGYTVDTTKKVALEKDATKVYDLYTYTYTAPTT